MNKDFKFKDVDLTFDMKKLPPCDQEYLRTMCFETTGQRSVKHSGKPFHVYYKHAKNFTLFNSKDMMYSYMNEFSGAIGNTASHLLEGKKFYFAWTYSKKY